MAYIVWLTLLTLFVFSFFSNGKVPIWLPILGYVIVISIRTKARIGDYRDWLKLNKRDEILKLEEVAQNMAERGLAFSGIRIKEESKVKEDFCFERKKKKRQFENELIDSLFLK